MLIEELLEKLVELGGSDLHISSNLPPAARIDGKLQRLDYPPLSPDDVEALLFPMLSNEQRRTLEQTWELDFSYGIEGLSRFRVNFYKDKGNYAAAFRTITSIVPSFDKLGLPEVVRKQADQPRGLILVTGPTGSGKSTTIASLIDYINGTVAKHIVTIEDPVEFIFSNKKSIVSQRQLLIDTPSFSDGVKYALRQDPDVIFIGEIRDRETVESALKAAETGHLVVSTIHTNDSVQTVARIINLFDPNERPFVRSQIANTLRGTISQKLVPTAEGGSRLPATEILVVTPTVRDFIQKDELEQIYELVKNGSFNNMTTMNMSLYKLYQNEKITKEIALEYSDNRSELEQLMRGIYHGTGMK